MNTATELATAIEESFKAVFPNSLIRARFTSNLCPCVMVTFMLHSSSDKCINSIAENDPAFTRIFIWGVGKDGSLNDALKVDMSVGGRMLVKSAPFVVKFGWRNKNKATPSQVVSHLSAYFAKVKDVVKGHMHCVKDDLGYLGL